LKNYKAAINDFTIEIKKDNKSAKAYFHRGLNYFQIKNKKSGCADLKIAGELGYVDAFAEIKKRCK